MKSTKSTNSFHRCGNWIVSTLLAGSVMGLSFQISAIYAQPSRSLYSKNHVPQGIEIFQDAAINAASAGNDGNVGTSVDTETGGPAAPEQTAQQPDLVVYPTAAAVRAAAASRQAVLETKNSGLQRSQATGGEESAAPAVSAAGTAKDTDPVLPDADSVPATEAPASELVEDSDGQVSPEPDIPHDHETVAEPTPSETERDAAAADAPSVTSSLALTSPTVLLTKTQAAATESEARSAAPAAPVYVREAITDISEDAMALYMGIMATECGSAWDYEGCLMIAQVIVNRVHSGHWGDLYGVLTAPNQFSTYSSGVWVTRQPTEAQRQAALDALAGKTVIDEDVLFFCTDAAYQSSSYFQTLDHRATFANTMFFAN